MLPSLSKVNALLRSFVLFEPITARLLRDFVLIAMNDFFRDQNGQI